MAYWIDDSFDTWPEVVRAGSPAAGLYVRCGAWISRGIWDGLIADAIVPTEVATMYGTREWISRLVDVGLWAIEETGFRDLRYFQAPNGTKLNPTPAEVADKRRKNRERQQRWAEKHKPKAKRATNGSPNALADGLVTVLPNPSPKEGKGARTTRSAPPDPTPLLGPADPRTPAQVERTQRGAAAARAAITDPRGAA